MWSMPWHIFVTCSREFPVHEVFIHMCCLFNEPCHSDGLFQDTMNTLLHSTLLCVIVHGDMVRDWWTKTYLIKLTSWPTPYPISSCLLRHHENVTYPRWLAWLNHQHRHRRRCMCCLRKSQSLALYPKFSMKFFCLQCACYVFVWWLQGHWKWSVQYMYICIHAYICVRMSVYVYTYVYICIYACVIHEVKQAKTYKIWMHAKKETNHESWSHKKI